MHKDHKTMKWCAVVAAAIVAIAAIASIAIQMIPAFDEWNEKTEVTGINEKVAAIVETQGYEMAGDTEDAAEEVVSAGIIHVTVKADAQEMDLMTAQVTVGEMLDAYGIPVGEYDIVTPEPDQIMEADSTIKIERITFEEVTVSEEVPFKTKVEGTDELPAGTKKVVQEGEKGEDKVTYKIKYSDGEEVSRKEIDRETVKKPVTKIVKKSTVGTINGKAYARKFTVKAYSYTGGGRTASGLPAAVGRIAVDPRVIPLGTKVYVEGYGFATAADTGGNIKGNTIDVYYNSESQCRQWGCRYITIYILK